MLVGIRSHRSHTEMVLMVEIQMVEVQMVEVQMVEVQMVQSVEYLLLVLLTPHLMAHFAPLVL